LAERLKFLFRLVESRAVTIGFGGEEVGCALRALELNVLFEIECLQVAENAERRVGFAAVRILHVDDVGSVLRFDVDFLAEPARRLFNLCGLALRGIARQEQVRRRPVVVELAGIGDLAEHVVSLKQRDFRADLIQRNSLGLDQTVLCSGDRGIGAVLLHDDLHRGGVILRRPQPRDQNGQHDRGEKRDEHDALVPEQRRQHVTQRHFLRLFRRAGLCI
jgi:hypothetical protein